MTDASVNPGGAITASSQEAADAGVHVLRARGNAVDGAIAAALATCVADPSNAGLGGYGGFMLVKRRGEPALCIQFPLCAPSHASPEKLARLHVDPLMGLQPFHVRRLCFAAGIPAAEAKQVGAIIEGAYRAFIETDAMLVEINPLIVTPDGVVRALDSKYTVDDNALYRHPDIAGMRDAEAGDPQERLARERGVNFVKLEGGDIGTLANGAGLAMSTLDVVAAAGEAAGHRPANFLDVGGGADAEAIATAMEVLLSDPNVRAVLFNVFGGITRCDEVAHGILTALERLRATLPIVVRLDGTNAEEGRRILADAAPPNIHVEATMLGAAARVVELVDGSAA